MDWINSLIQQTLNSDVATGMASGALLMGVLAFIGFQLRSLPQRMMNLAQRQFTVTLTVYGDDQVFHPLSLWLAGHPATKKARRLNVVTRWEEDGKQTHQLTPGPGIHILRHQKRWFLVTKDVSQPGSGDSSGGRSPPNGGFNRKSETLTIATTGRDPTAIQALIDEVANVQKSRDTIPVYFWAGNGYARCAERLKRPLSTVYMDDELKQRVVDDLHNFLARRRWYADRGIPWRRGYLFEGPPGTGKSTLIFALACLLEKPVYIINPSTVWDDGGLMQAMNEAGSGLVVIEDADTFKVTQERSQKKPPRSYGGSTVGIPVGGSAGYQQRPQGEEESGITLSGLLNAIDGIASAEGRVLFITSNHPDALDAALLRPGRIDVRERLGLAHADVAREMFAAFFPDEDGEAFAREIAPRLPMAPAAIQNMLLERGEAHTRGAEVHVLRPIIKKSPPPSPITNAEEKR